jgi:hypothetical protein
MTYQPVTEKETPMATTPGPWYDTTSGAYVMDGCGRVIAQTRPSQNDFMVWAELTDSPEAKANNRMLAAAHTMHAALQAAHELLNDPRADINDYVDVLEIIEEALRKAHTDTLLEAAL